MADKPPKPPGQQEIADRVGVEKMTISRAIKRGQIKAGIIFNPDGSYAGVSDVEAAAADYWANASVRAHVPDPTPGDPAAKAPVDGEMTPQQRKVHWEALTKELQFKEAARELIPAAKVREDVENAFMNCKTHLLAIPARARQVAPTLTLEHLALIEGLIREACEKLALPDETPPEIEGVDDAL